MTAHDDDQHDDKNDETSDEALWAHVTRDIQPLSGARRRPPDQPSPVAGDRPGVHDRAAQSRTAADPPHASKHAAPAPEAPGREVDKRTSERVRRGQMEIQARLDLHGLGRVAAQTALRAFILRCHDRKKRHVLVITGKGKRGSGVLRENVPLWLEEPPLRDLVLQVSPARPQDGGDGALYVLLRRRRETKEI